MNQSPWPRVAIDDVTEMIKRPETPMPGVQYRQIGVRLWGVGAYEREVLDGAQTQYKELYRVEADDIIVNKIWARNGSVAVVTPELAGCYASGEFPLYAPDKAKLEPRWFHWITKTAFFWQQCDEKSHGTSGKNRIRPERFLEIEIPLPPLAEQRRIVARIETLATKVEAARTLREQAVSEGQALLDSAVKQIFEHGLKMRWREASIEELCELGPQNGLFKTKEFYGNGTLLLNVADVYKGLKIDASRLERVIATEDEIQKYRLEEGDVCIVRSSIKDTGIGQACVFVGFPENVVFECHLMRMHLDRYRVDPYLFALFFNTSIGKEQILANRRASVMTTINQRDIKSLRFPLAPLPEQRRIVAHLDALQAKLALVQQHQAATQARLDALLPSILDQAFKGAL